MSQSQWRHGPAIVNIWLKLEISHLPILLSVQERLVRAKRHTDMGDEQRPHLLPWSMQILDLIC